MANSIHQCALTLHKVMKKNRFSRATVTSDYFRDIVDRRRIENSFLEQLNSYTVENYRLAIMKLNHSSYLLARTYDKYLKDDPYYDDGDEWDD